MTLQRRDLLKAAGAAGALALTGCAANMIAKGVQSITIAPMFLGVGKHAREDLPEMTKRLAKDYPNIQIELMPSIGEHPELIATISNILTKSL